MKSNLKHYLLLAIVMSFIDLSWSQDVAKPNQTKEIIYDYKTKKVSGTLPFDVFVKLVVKNMTPSDIQASQIYEVYYKKGVRGIKNIKTEEIINILNSEEEFKVFEENCNCEVKKKVNEMNSTTGTVQIKVTNEIETPEKETLTFNPLPSSKNSSEALIKPLKPNKLYEIIIIKNNSEKNQLVFKEFLSLYKASPNDDDKLNTFFIKHILPLRNNNAERKRDVVSFSSDFTSFKNNIGKVLKFVDQNSVPVANLVTRNTVSITDNLIQHVGNLLKVDKLNVALYAKIMDQFLNNNATQISIFSSGITKETKPFDYKKQLSNIKKNIKLIEDLTNEIAVLRNSQNDANLDTFRTVFLIPALSTLKNNLNSLHAFDKNITPLIDKYIPELVLISAGTQHDDLKTANANTIIPDLGLINSFGYTSSGDIRYIARPYVGINIHFSGINRQQRLEEVIYKKFRHKFSLAIGVTVGKIDTEDFEDLYNGISPTLGLNFRIHEQIRLGAGSLFLRKKSQNPLLDSTKVTLAPYASISFDLGLFKELGDFKKKIGF